MDNRCHTGVGFLPTRMNAERGQTSTQARVPPRGVKRSPLPACPLCLWSWI